MYTTFEISKNWEDGLLGSISVTNDKPTVIHNWVLTIETTFRVEDIWGAEILESSGNCYTIMAKGQNSRLEPGESICFGLVGENIRADPPQVKVISEEVGLASDRGLMLKRRKILKFASLGGFSLLAALLTRYFLGQSSSQTSETEEANDDTVQPSPSATGLSGHSSDVNSLVFTPDSKGLISASRDKTVKMWDLLTYTVSRNFPGHSEEVYSVALGLPESNLLVSGSADKTVKTWDLSTGDDVLTLEGYGDFVNFVSVDPSGRLIATASYDGSVKIRDAETGEVIYLFDQHDGIVLTTIFSPDGRYLASGGVDKVIRLWDVETGEQVRVFSGHTSDANWLVFSSDSQSLYSCSRDNTVRRWNVGTGENVNTMHGHVGEVFTIALHPNQTILASAGRDMFIRIWDLVNNKEIQAFQAHPEWIYSLAFSPDGSLLASGAGEVVDNLKIWSTAEFI